MGEKKLYNPRDTYYSQHQSSLGLGDHPTQGMALHVPEEILTNSFRLPESSTLLC